MNQACYMLSDDSMQKLARVVSILVVGSSLMVFAAMKVGAVDMPALGLEPAPFPAPGNPGFPAPVPPIPSPIFPGPGGTGNAAGATANGLGGVPGGGTGGMSSSGIH
jgi:hypothetical protein